MKSRSPVRGCYQTKLDSQTSSSMGHRGWHGRNPRHTELAPMSPPPRCPGSPIRAIERKTQALSQQSAGVYMTQKVFFHVSATLSLPACVTLADGHLFGPPCFHAKEPRLSLWRDTRFSKNTLRFFRSRTELGTIGTRKWSLDFGCRWFSVGGGPGGIAPLKPYYSSRRLRTRTHNDLRKAP